MGGTPDLDTGPSPEEQALEKERKEQDKQLQQRQIERLRRRRGVATPSIFELSTTLG